MQTAFEKFGEDKRHHIINNFTAAAIEACGPAYHQEFIRDLLILLKTKKNWSMARHCYAPYYPDKTRNGSILWEEIMLHGDSSGYYIPKEESSLVFRCRELLSHLFPTLEPHGLMIGPGSAWARLAKEIPALRSMGVVNASAWDLNPKFADGAAEDIGRELQIPVQAIVGDFTKPLPDKIRLPETRPIVATMFGSTITQFSLLDQKNGNSPSLCGFLNNLHNVTYGNSFILATIDSNLDTERSLDCYRGRHFRTWQNWLWDFTAYMTGDNRFNPRSIEYFPKVDPETRAVIHSHIVMENTRIRINNECFRLKKGDLLEIGISQKYTPEEIKAAASHCDWEEIAVLRDNGSVRLLLYMDKHMSKEWATRVKSALKRAPANMLG